MMNFALICTNPECNMCNVELDPGKYTLKYDKSLGKMFPTTETPRHCYACEKDLIFVEKHNQIADFSVSTFKGQPDEKKKEILKQRYKRGMKATGMDEVEGRKREKIADFLGKKD